MLSEKRKKWLEEFRQKQEDKKLKRKIKKREKLKKEREKLSAIKFVKPKKRRVGRPKKRGPKKKRIRRKIVVVKKKRPVIDFKIVSVLNGKQNDYIGSYHTYSDAYSKLKELELMNANVIFPRRFLNSVNICNSKDEYLILERNRFGDKSNNLLRNEFGRFVEQKITNNTKWIVRDKAVRLVEETFWVYGFDHKSDRKTFSWIFDTLLVGSIVNSYDIIRVLIYKNKLVIKYDDKPLSLIMCKNTSDSVRLYNTISDKLKERKIKQIICIGSYNLISDSRRELESEIMDLTGWSKRKLQRSTN